MEREKERDRYKGMREQWKEPMRKGTIGRERERQGGKRERHTLQTRTQEGLAPGPPLVFVHPMKNGIPHSGFDEGAVILVEPVAWSAKVTVCQIFGPGV